MRAVQRDVEREGEGREREREREGEGRKRERERDDEISTERWKERRGGRGVLTGPLIVALQQVTAKQQQIDYRPSIAEREDNTVILDIDQHTVIGYRRCRAEWWHVIRQISQLLWKGKGYRLVLCWTLQYLHSLAVTNRCHMSFYLVEPDVRHA